MDHWETEEKKQGKDTTRKILLAMIIVLVIAIIAIGALLMIMRQNTFRLLIDGEEKKISANFIKTDTTDQTTYLNISEMADLLGNEYHVGEYNVFSSDQDKCYIKSEEETSSFYLNSNKIAKLAVEEQAGDYDILNSQKNVIQMNGQFYAPLDAIEKGFNVVISQTENRMSITTLNTLLTNLDKQFNKVTSTGTGSSKETIYKSFTEEESFNNKKAALYGYIVCCKNSSGLYGVITTSGSEILPDKYKSIEFLESTQEFFVTNSLGKMGIVDATGKNIIEQNYDSIKLINKDPKLYMVGVGQKYGVLGETGNVVIYPEYDAIGVDPTVYKSILNQYVLLDNTIPVCQNNKYGLFDVAGKKIVDLQYDGIGYELETITLNENEKPVNATVVVEDANGIVVKQGEKYGLVDATTGKLLVPARTDGIYSITNAGINIYYMAYQNNESNLIEQLISRGIIQNPQQLEEMTEKDKATVTNTLTENINTTSVNATSTIVNESIGQQ